VQKFIKLLFLVSFFNIIIVAQNYNSNAPFISIFAGDLAISSENITNYYNSRSDWIYGIGFGVPLNRSLTIDCSASYYKKESRFYLDSDETENAHAFLRQLILNAGLQYHLLPNRIVGLSFFFGGNYALVEEERKGVEGNLIYEIEDSGNLGLYGGANFEISLGKKPFAIYGDVKYTYSWDPVLEFEDSYRDIRYTGGLKIYLAKRWK
jgi:hypothetical protein